MFNWLNNLYSRLVKQHELNSVLKRQFEAALRYVLAAQAFTVAGTFKYAVDIQDHKTCHCTYTEASNYH